LNGREDRKNVNSKLTNYSIGNVALNILGKTATNAPDIITLILKAQTYTMFGILIRNVMVVYSDKVINLRMTGSSASADYSLDVTSGSTSSVVFEFDLSEDIDIAAQQFTQTIYIVLS